MTTKLGLSSTKLSLLAIFSLTVAVVVVALSLLFTLDEALLVLWLEELFPELLSPLADPVIVTLQVADFGGVKFLTLPFTQSPAEIFIFVLPLFMDLNFAVNSTGLSFKLMPLPDRKIAVAFPFLSVAFTTQEFCAVDTLRNSTAVLSYSKVKVDAVRLFAEVMLI
jgi:hypothetical protein